MSQTSLIPSHARRHELLADVAEQSARFLSEKHGVEAEAAADVGNALAAFLAQHWHGQNIYFVADRAFQNSERDWEIFRRMERGNAHALAREFDISYIRVYQIHKRCLEEYRRLTQHDLFTQADQGTAEGADPAQEEHAEDPAQAVQSGA